jgi:hypothetical protein
VIAKPQFKKVRRSSPFRPLFDDLNRAIANQNRMPGTGFGLLGNAITRTSQDYMVGVVSSSPAIGGATVNDDKTRDVAMGVAIEQTLEIKDSAFRLVPAGDEDTASFTCYNWSRDPIDQDTLIICEKYFGTWVITWVECSS